MESVKIDIINPKAFQILQNLADLNLITIKKEETSAEFEKLLTRLRGKKGISLEEITKEVEEERSSRYEK